MTQNAQQTPPTAPADATSGGGIKWAWVVAALVIAAVGFFIARNTFQGDTAVSPDKETKTESKTDADKKTTPEATTKTDSTKTDPATTTTTDPATSTPAPAPAPETTPTPEAKPAPKPAETDKPETPTTAPGTKSSVSGGPG